MMRPGVHTRPGLKKDAINLARAGLEKMVDEMTEIAKETAPHLTGNLAASIDYDELKELHFRVYTQTDYGAYVELGTSKMRAQPYLAPAFQQAQGSLKIGN